MVVTPTPCAFPPVTAPTGLLIGFPQVYVVPAGTIFPLPSAGVTENALPEQIAADVRLVINGFGFTVTVIVNVSPVQLPATGVTV